MVDGLLYMLAATTGCVVGAAVTTTGRVVGGAVTTGRGATVTRVVVTGCTVVDVVDVVVGGIVVVEVLVDVDVEAVVVVPNAPTDT